MIGQNPEISVFRLPLDVAGQTVVRQRIGYFHLWQFENSADGTTSLEGQISAQFGSLATADDGVPMSYNTRMQFRPSVDLVQLNWPAQPGIRAVIVASSSPDALEANNIPAKQLVFQGQAPNIDTGVSTVTTTVGLLRASSSFRQRLVIQAPVTNPATVVIGPSGVTLANGMQLEPGSSMSLNTSAPIYGLSAATGCTLRFLEELA